MTETNPLLLLLMRSEKRPPLKTGELLLRTVLGTGKKSHGVVVGQYEIILTHYPRCWSHRRSDWQGL